jgi:acetyl esterase
LRAINPDVMKLLAAARAANAPALEALPPEETRRNYAETRRKLQPPLDPVEDVRNLTIPGPAGPVGLRIFRPASALPTLPCLVFMHGGGWVLGDLDSHEGICRRLAVQAECCVISVDYRLAPEHPYPAAVEDSAAALGWVAANAATLAIDPDRIAVGGDSAGGNLAAVLALMGRDGTLPRSTFQMLLYPVTDLHMTGTSYETVADGMPVTAATMRFFADHYLPDAAGRDDWRASPLRAASLAGTPPAFVLTCGHDPLCSEGQLYAERLEREGVRVTALHLSDQAHGILNMGAAVGSVAGVLAYAAATMRDVWREEHRTA